MHVALARALRLVSAAFVLAACAPEASLAQDLGPNVEMRVGQEITFPVSVADGHVTPGPARASRPGSAKPRDGEITVSVATQKGSPYAEITASEKTSAPIDFVATGLVGNIKIDEVRVCGRPDAPASAHIYSGSWRISLNRFSLGPDPDCP